MLKMTSSAMLVAWSPILSKDFAIKIGLVPSSTTLVSLLCILSIKSDNKDLYCLSISALDPIATAKIEDLINELKENYTIIIVTHSMSQASRVSSKTAFFHLGNLVEYGETGKIFTKPDKEQTNDYITGRFG